MNLFVSNMINIIILFALIINIIGIAFVIRQLNTSNTDALKNSLCQHLEHQQEKFSRAQTSQQTELKADILNTLLQTLKHQHDQSSTNYQNLSTIVHKRLHELSEEVTQKLSSGFEKNQMVFHKVMERLVLIDQAQEKITELSDYIIKLRQILTDKSSRGAFGEVQLTQLIANIIPTHHYKLQETLPNGKRVDCLLLMPSHGHISIDAKFPLENYQRQFLEAEDKRLSSTQFKQDIKKHIDDIASKYIVPNFTIDGAIMFIPAEAVFAHIHAKHPDLIQYAQKNNVWLTSPTTLMAVLNTALGVIKDHATRAQMNIIKEHLSLLAEDFKRFEKRMDQLAKHIGQANNDVGLIQVSSQKITKRFTKIENCDTLEQISTVE